MIIILYLQTLYKIFLYIKSQKKGFIFHKSLVGLSKNPTLLLHNLHPRIPTLFLKLLDPLAFRPINQPGQLKTLLVPFFRFLDIILQEIFLSYVFQVPNILGIIRATQVIII
jgi:hypothetical protein